MKILIADDDMVTCQILESLLSRWGYQVETVQDGNLAWEALTRPDPPRLAILDRIMPGIEGAELCRRFRKQPQSESSYLILLTAKGHKADVVEGLEAGANDYITKPFDYEELRARVRVGCQMAQLQKALADRVAELQEALDHIRTLQGILPICSYCKRIRNDKNYWQQLESYFATHAVRFSHSICPECYKIYVDPGDEEAP